MMIEFLLFFIPRFVTDEVALAYDINHNLKVFCLKGQEQVGDDMFIHCYGVIKTFTWFGIGFGGKCKLKEKL